VTLGQYIETYFPVLASWSIGCAGAHSLIQTIKMARRECGARRVPDIVLRILAGAFSGGITTVVAYRLFSIDIEQSVTHGALVAILYPVLMAGLMASASKYFPELHRRLSIPTRRPSDRPDPVAAPAAAPIQPAPAPAHDPHDDTVERYF
jgi:hypothetical protein